MKMIDGSGIVPFRITSDGDVHDVNEIHELLAVVHPYGQCYTLKSNAGELYFETEDMDAFYKQLESFDILYVHKLHEHPWGQRVVRFYDPDGHIIEAAEKLDAVIARFVAQGLSPEETADRMGIPLDFVVSSLNVAK